MIALANAKATSKAEAIRADINPLWASRPGRFDRTPALVEIYAEGDDTRGDGVAEDLVQFRFVPARQKTADRVDERVQAQEHQHTAVERQHHRLDRQAGASFGTAVVSLDALGGTPLNQVT